MATVPRKIIQMMVAGTELLGLSDDGLIWVWQAREGQSPKWTPLPPLPDKEF